MYLPAHLAAWHRKPPGLKVGPALWGSWSSLGRDGRGDWPPLGPQSCPVPTSPSELSEQEVLQAVHLGNASGVQLRVFEWYLNKIILLKNTYQSFTVTTEFRCL